MSLHRGDQQWCPRTPRTKDQHQPLKKTRNKNLLGTNNRSLRKQSLIHPQETMSHPTKSQPMMQRILRNRKQREKRKRHKMPNSQRKKKEPPLDLNKHKKKQA